MRKSIILGLVLIMLLALPVAVRAQSAPTLDTLAVQLWPDYDKTSVLVIYDFSFSATTILPMDVSLHLPAGAQLLAVAQDESGKLVNLNYKPPTRQGNFDVLIFSAVARTTYHVEYYLPYTRVGDLHSFSYAWPGDYAVNAATLRLQQPPDATNVKTDPALPSIGQQSDGFTYFAKDLGALPAGQETRFNISYQKSTDTLSVSQQGVQPTTPLDQPVTGQASVTSFLPWLLGGLGVLLIVGGGTWYWLAGRSSIKVTSRSRRRHSLRSADEDETAVAYCAQCGKRAQPGDRFCRACGARIKHNED